MKKQAEYLSMLLKLLEKCYKHFFYKAAVFLKQNMKVLKSILVIKKLMIQRSGVFCQVFATTCCCLQIMQGTYL